MKQYMQTAIREATKAALEDEVPVGCVIVYNGAVIAKTHNRNVAQQDATAHAEMLAIREACNVRHSANLNGCELYVTMEPCPMCAIINAKISKVVFG
jgi:tRNA(adenine34) deaminase